MQYPVLTLKADKETSIRNGHRWIFSGAVATVEPVEDGSIVAVKNARGNLLGFGMYHSKTSISVRLLGFGSKDPIETLKSNILSAIALRSRLFRKEVTNAVRLIHSESDGIPGLVVDQYADVLVVQISTLGTERLKPLILETLIEALKPRAILEKSDMPSRREEGLEAGEGMLYGPTVDRVVALENSMKFEVDFSGQKTGFFLDQREERDLVRSLAHGKTVLNAFGYTGGFSVAALAGGATKVDTLDISQAAVDQARKNIALNSFDTGEQGYFTEDVFLFLREKPLNYDLVILDPPAFAKKKADIERATAGYREINATTMKKMPAESLLLTASCSYFMNPELFRKMLFLSARDAKRNVRILSEHRQAFDHPGHLMHPEGEYLKSFLLAID